MLVTVFRSKLRPENAAEFQALADRMRALAEAMPGFLSYKVYRADDGERCSIIEFQTAEQLLAWRNHPEHVTAQELGRQRFTSTTRSWSPNRPGNLRSLPESIGTAAGARSRPGAPDRYIWLCWLMPFWMLRATSEGEHPAAEAAFWTWSMVMLRGSPWSSLSFPQPHETHIDQFSC